MLSSLASITSISNSNSGNLYNDTSSMELNKYGLPLPIIYIPIRDNNYANWANSSQDLTNVSITNSPSIVSSNSFRSNSQYMNFVQGSNQRLNLPNRNVDSAFSVSLWVKLLPGNVDTANIWCISNYFTRAESDKKYTWAIWYGPVGTAIRFEYARDGPEGIVRRGLTQSGVNTNTWYHIVVIRKNDNSLELWVNNVKSTAQISGINEITLPTDGWTSVFHACGKSSYEPIQSTGAQIDDIRYYNSVLTPTDIQTLYNARNQTFDFVR
jgi:hypothetical protein